MELTLPLIVPYVGFTEFELYREPGDEDVYVFFSIDGDKQSYSMELEQLRLWLRLAGVDAMMIEKTCDFAWSFPRVRYILGEQRLLVPDDQRRPDHDRMSGEACLWDYAHRRIHV